MDTNDNLEQMVLFLEDKIEDMAETIFDLRLEIKILTDVIRDLENELRAAQ
jgi:prefoldin subunit 5